MSDFYVYLHSRKSDGVVFYVGKGRRDRYKRPKRSKGWLENVSLGKGFDSRIFKSGLSEQEALRLETSLIKSPDPSWKLCNKVVSFSTNKFDLQKIRDCFTYDESSKTCLRYLRDNRSINPVYKRKSGDEAGYNLETGSGQNYYMITVDSQRILVHRLIYMLFYGEIPEGFVINHKNNDSLDNRISNLEAVTQATNSRRTYKHRVDSTGTYEWCFKKKGKILWYSVACWTEEDGKRRTKIFSYLKFGKEQATRLAIDFRKQKIQELSHLGYILN